MPKRGKLTKRDRNRTLIAGIRKHQKFFDQRGLGPDQLKADDLVAHLEAQLRLLDDIDRYDKMKSQAILDEAALEAMTLDLWFLVRNAVKSFFAPESPTVRDFGMKPKRKPKIPIVTKAIAVAKRRATRKERRTMGKRQKKNIKGY